MTCDAIIVCVVVVGQRKPNNVKIKHSFVGFVGWCGGSYRDRTICTKNVKMRIGTNKQKIIKRKKTIDR